MKIIFISDTHNHHKELSIPNGDIVIHSGDVSGIGKINEIASFLSWFSDLPHPYKIFTPGNHDWGFQLDNALVKSIIPKNVIYLENNSVNVCNLNIYGTPVQPIFCNWAFNKSSEELKKYWAMVPENIDILVTHCPPYGILDNCFEENVGCKLLAKELKRIKPKIHAFGHIHEQHGIIEKNGTKFINASNLNDNYVVSYEPIVIEI